MIEGTTMKGVSITDQNIERGCLAFDLIDLVKLMQSKAEQSRWTVRRLECTGKTAEDLYRISDCGTVITGQVFRRLVEGLDQVIDGTFEGFLNEETNPWVRITAVDSSAFDVESSDESLLDRLKTRFKSVVDLPS